MFGFGAEAPLTPSSTLARYDVAPDRYLSVVWIVHTASAAVSGTLSDHLPPPRRWNVHTRPFRLCVQLLAQSPTSFSPGPYCTSCGNTIP